MLIKDVFFSCVGVVFAWFDNLDLNVSTPNGRRTSNVLSQESQQPHAAGILETGRARPGRSTLVVPRLSKSELQMNHCNAKSGSLPLLHYNGPTKVNPPALNGQSGIPYQDVCARQASLVAAQEKDTIWLNSLNSHETPMEWAGFNNQEARQNDPKAPASTYMFGPLIDAKASHPDTVLT